MTGFFFPANCKVWAQFTKRLFVENCIKCPELYRTQVWLPLPLWEVSQWQFHSKLFCWKMYGMSKSSHKLHVSISKKCLLPGFNGMPRFAQKSYFCHPHGVQSISFQIIARKLIKCPDLYRKSFCHPSHWSESGVESHFSIKIVHAKKGWKIQISTEKLILTKTHPLW